MPDLDVLFVQTQVCTRTWKEAKALTDVGVRVSLLELQKPSGFKDYSMFQECVNLPFHKDHRTLLLQGRSIRRGVAGFLKDRKFDVVHTQNGPDAFGAWLPRLTRTPAVHDIHDIETETAITYTKGWRRAAIAYANARWERLACRRSDALLCTSPLMAQYFRDKYGVPNVHSIENKPFQTEETLLPKLSATDGRTHLVYAGGIHLHEGATRNLMPTFQGLAKLGYVLHLYPNFFDKTERATFEASIEREPNIVIHPLVPQDQFIHTVSQYDYGLIWFREHNRNIEYTTQNKLYEFQVAKVPIITNLRRGYTSQYLQAKRCGIVVDVPDEVPAALDELGPVIFDTSDCYMHGSDLVRVYDSVLGGR